MSAALFLLLGLLSCAIHRGAGVYAGEGELQSVIWSSCAIPALNISRQAAFFGDATFTYLDTCISLRDLARSSAYALPSSVPASSCFAPLSLSRAQSFANTSSADCEGAAQAIADAIFCAAGAGNLAAVAAAVPLFAAQVTANVPCVSGSVGQTRLSAAVTFAATAFTAPTVKFHCQGGKVKAVPCSSQLQGSFSLPTFSSGDCDITRGVQATCTACQPFFDAGVTTQPYLFLLFPGLKLVIVKILELFFIFKLVERLRQSIEEDLRKQKPPPEAETHPPGFVPYINHVLLLDGQRRIRQRLTSRHRDGKDNILKLLERYKKHVAEKNKNGEDAEPLTSEEYKELVHDQGIALQAASFRKADCVKPCLDALEECGIVADETDDDVRDNEVLDWYFNEICAYGSRHLLVESGDTKERLLECVRVQLDLMAKRAALPLVGPRAAVAPPSSGEEKRLRIEAQPVGTAGTAHRHEPIYEDTTTVENGSAIAPLYRDPTDTIVVVDDRTGAIIAVDGEKVDAEAQPEPAAQLLDDVAETFMAAATSNECHRQHKHRVKHRHQRSRERLASTFLADAHEVSLTTATAAPASHVVEVALRSTVAPPSASSSGEQQQQVVEEHLVICNDSVSLLRVADTVAHAIAKHDTVHESLAHVRVKLFHAGTSDVSQALDLSLHVSDVIKADSSRLCLRYMVEFVSDEAFARLRARDSNASFLTQLAAAEYEHCLDEYDAYDAQIDKIREDFEAHAPTEPASFPADWLIADTGKNLARILDGRVTTIAKEFILSLCGDEVIYECDITTDERYELRDAIPQLTTDIAQTKDFIERHHIDPLVTYHRCYDYLTVYKTWNSEVRHGVLRAFQSERPAVLDLLASLYSTIRDRLQVENRTELDEVACRALALHFKHNLDDVSRIVPVVLIGEQVVKSIFAVNTYLLIIAVFYAVAIFIVSCIDGTRNNTSGWTAYEEIYFRFLNTGTAASICCGSLSNWTINAEQRFQSKFFAVVDRLLLAISFTLLLPPLVTHIIPGFSSYCWVVLGTTFILAIPVFVMRRVYMHLEDRSRDEFELMTEHERLRRRRRLKWYLVVLFLLVSFIGLVFMTGFLQSSYNWAYLLYRHSQFDLNYITVLQFEANGRTLQCYYEQAISSAYMNLQWISSFI